MLSFKINKKSLDEITAKFKDLDKKIERKAVRRGGVKWAKQLIQTMKNNITWDETHLKRKLDYKVIRLKKKRGYWIGVGVESGALIPIERGKGDIYAATKARWYEGGYHAYPKGLPSGRKGKGWRAGLRGRRGKLVYKTEFISKSYAIAQATLLPTIEESIRQAVEGQ